MRRLVRIAAVIEAVSDRTGRAVAVAMPLMVLAIGWEVFARYALNAPTIWAYDTALMLWAWMGLVGGAMAMRQDRHIRVDILVQHLPVRARALLELLTLPLVVFFLGLVVWQVGLTALDALASGARRPTEWAPPLVLFLAPAVLGAALLLLQCAATAIRALVTLAGRGGGA